MLSGSDLRCLAIIAECTDSCPQVRAITQLVCLGKKIASKVSFLQSATSRSGLSSLRDVAGSVNCQPCRIGRDHARKCGLTSSCCHLYVTCSVPAPIHPWERNAPCGRSVCCHRPENSRSRSSGIATANSATNDTSRPLNGLRSVFLRCPGKSGIPPKADITSWHIRY